MTMNEFEELLEELKTTRSKTFNISCCRSYMTPKGRCYTCPENDLDEEID